MRKTLFFFFTLGFFLLLYESFAHAISLGFVPSSQNVVAGKPVSVDLTISGLGDLAPPVLSTFDLDVRFNPAILEFILIFTGSFFEEPSFGSSLGDPMLDDETLTRVASSAGGVVNLFELSFLGENELDGLQRSSFTLATLTFNTLAVGVSPLTLSVNALGDAEGNPLVADISSGSVTAIPEPSTLLFVASGLAVFVVFRRKLLVA